MTKENGSRKRAGKSAEQMRKKEEQENKTENRRAVKTIIG